MPPNNLNEPDTIGAVEGVNMALTRAQHLEEKERRRVLANKYNLSDHALNLWCYMEPQVLSSMYTHLVDVLNIVPKRRLSPQQELLMKCWPSNSSYLFEVIRLTMCYMEAQVSGNFLSYNMRWFDEVTSATLIVIFT